MSTVPIPPPADVSAAGRLLSGVEIALDAWHGGPGLVGPGDRVRAGHDAIEGIDALLRELYRQREILSGEIHRDNIERDARIDALLAEIRRERGAQ